MSVPTMRLFLVALFILGECAGRPTLFSQQVAKFMSWNSRQQSWLDQAPRKSAKFLLPFQDSSSSKRANEIDLKRKGYLYGPSMLGNSSYFPTGALGSAMVQQHIDQWLHDASWLTNIVDTEILAATAALNTSEHTSKIDIYNALYEGQWQSSLPYGPAPGAISNATQDLLFSMERLSVNPYGVRRLHPTADKLPFELDSVVSRELSGLDLRTLHQSGRLFYVDHKYQAAYPVSKGRFTAACSAYFFIHPDSGDFLPLAIKTNVGADLIYSPIDTPEDWLLAKTMFNMNDLFHGQIYHLANSHAVSEIVHQAALRTLSDSHPVLGLLNRVMHQAYAIRPMGEKVLFNPSGFFDQSFAITNEGVRQFATEFYGSTAGAFQANYFLADLVSRGLINCTYGPVLKSFPFFEDANVLHSSIHSFVLSFVDSYYVAEEGLAQDNELQAWIQEASNEALVIDFPPSPLLYKETLVDILTQIAFLTGVSHHVLNSGEPAATSGVLPFHPSALYKSPPMQKGIEDISPYLTPAAEAIQHVALLARFNRPRLEDTQETLLYMFSSAELLDKCPPEIRRAASTFHGEMKDFSGKLQKRKFGSDGLSQNMPFVWRGLDPTRIPYFLSV